MSLEVKTIVIDAGHGGKDVGAINKDYGLKESEMALDVALKTKQWLDSLMCFNVLLTRDCDKFLELDERYMFANRMKADSFVSVHFNAADNPNVPPSFEVFTTRGQNNSDKLATEIIEQNRKIFPNQKIRSNYSDGDADKEANFTVIKGTNCPSVLVECEFIHTIEGAKIISQASNRNLMALVIAKGLCKFHGVNVSNLSRPQPKTLEQRVTAIEKHLGL